MRGLDVSSLVPHYVSADRSDPRQSPFQHRLLPRRAARVRLGLGAVRRALTLDDLCGGQVTRV